MGSWGNEVGVGADHQRQRRAVDRSHGNRVEAEDGVNPPHQSARCDSLPTADYTPAAARSDRNREEVARPRRAEAAESSLVLLLSGDGRGAARCGVRGGNPCESDGSKLWLVEKKWETL